MSNPESSKTCRVCGDEAADYGYCSDCLDYEVCTVCGGHDLQVRMWCRLNGPMALEVLESSEDETAWCEGCQDHRYTKLRQVFIDEIEERVGGAEKVSSFPEDLPCGNKYIVRI